MGCERAPDPDGDGISNLRGPEDYTVLALQETLRPRKRFYQAKRAGPPRVKRDPSTT
jgi:hypothetical protein